MIKTNYKHPNEHVFIIASRPIVFGEVLAKCTCGYETRQYDRADGKCPNCNSSAHEKLMSPTRTEKLSHVYGYEFTKEKAIINYRKIEVIYRQDEEDSKKDSLAVSEVKTDFIIEYETNKKGNKQFKPKRIVTIGDKQEVCKLLKSDIEYRYIKGDTETSAYDALKAISAYSDYGNLAAVIWGIVNKYKYCYDAIQKGFLIGYDCDISALKTWNEFVAKLSDKEIECLKKIYDMENSENYSYTTSYRYIIREYSNLKKNFEDMDKFSEFIDTKINLHENARELRRTIPIDITRYSAEIAELIYGHGFTIEELEELFAHAERQAFNLSYRFNDFIKGCRIYKKLNIAIDKKPRELAIYLAKMKAICDIAGFYGNKKFFIKDEDSTYGYSLSSDLITVKTVYEHFGFKGLDILLVNHHMEKYIAYTVSSLNHPISESKPIAVAFTEKFTNTYNSTLKENYLPITLLTLDGQVINEKKEIEKTLIELAREAVLSKGEATC